MFEGTVTLNRNEPHYLKIKAYKQTVNVNLAQISPTRIILHYTAEIPPEWAEDNAKELAEKMRADLLEDKKLTEARITSLTEHGKAERLEAEIEKFHHITALLYR